MTISDIFDWAWANGLNIRLESRSQNFAHYNPSRYNPSGREYPDYSGYDGYIKDTPVLVFTREDKHLKLEAINWAEMVLILEHKAPKIFSDLCMKPFKNKNKK